MSVLIDVLRCFTLPELYKVNDSRELTLKGWLASKQFKVEENVLANEFKLKIYDLNDIYIPFAFDINRMATSSFESIHGIEPNQSFPKSVGWLIVRLYYSAYYAAQAVLRLFGISCSQFDQQESRVISEIAKVWGYLPDKSVSKGYYCCVLDWDSQEISCKKLDNSHADVWFTLYEYLEQIATSVNDDDAFINEEKKEVIEYIYELRYGLSCRNTKSNGNFLSMVRNQVNYQHSMGAWYPYNGRVAEHSSLFGVVDNWKKEFSIDNLVNAKPENDLLLFAETCSSIVSLCFSLTKDLHLQNSDCFLKHGASSFLNRAKVKI
ncbi:hypothetical protein [Vibrio sp. 10N.261.51.C6]|uniref:hypothetical protein n=1 Tax=Vibrio sp. 10N.261.51.C6 TaxID=3229676 RepID=UPI00354E01E8